MLTTKEAISSRRSIRKFKADPIPEEHLMELLEAARLAPSGCNAQPWRFKIVTEPDVKKKLAEAAFNQSFVEAAPAVIVCCVDVGGYVDGSMSGVQDLGRIQAIEGGIVKVLEKRLGEMKSVPLDQLGPIVSLNAAIAIEHIVLRALDFGLGTCWVRLFDVEAVKNMFSLGDEMHVAALLPIGYPAENPAPRKRLPLKEILL